MMTTDPQEVVRLALEAFKSKDRDRTAELIAQLVRTNPPLGGTWGPIARMANSIGEATSAIAAMRIHAANAPEDRERQLELANVLEANNRHGDAIELARRLVKQWPDHPSTHHFLGHVLAQTGSRDEALEHLRKAIAMYPLASDSWLTLTSLKKFQVGDPELDQLRATVLRASSEPVLSQGTLFYALGKALDDVGEGREAFAAYTQGAALIRTERKPETAENKVLLEETRRDFNRAFLQKLSPSKELSDRPIFVLGLPRSGTTLMEQILVAHSAVKEGAEAGVFRHAAMALQNFRPSSLLALDQDPRWRGEVFTRMARSYLHLLDERFGPGGGRIIDKTLTHTKWIGMLAHILPNARFIWMRRNPGAIAWSCFKTRFAKGINWSWSLEDIGRQFRFVDQMHEHWTREFGDRVLTVQYEDLVANSETWIPRALAHVGLRDEPQTRNFHEVKRVVRTASLAQVRQPLYSTSVGGWREYERELQPFFNAYNGR